MDTPPGNSVAAFRLPVRRREDDLCSAFEAAGYCVERGEREHHQDRFMDTQDGRLYRVGVRLRLRDGGAIWQLMEGVRVVAEQHSEGGVAPDDGPVGERLVALVGGRALLPQADLRVVETPLVLSVGSGHQLGLRLVGLSASAPRRGGWIRGPRLIVLESDDAGLEVEHLVPVLRDLLRLAPAGDPLSVALAVLELPLPGAPIPAALRLTPGDTMGVAGAKILARQGYKMWANTEGTVEDLDDEFLHDLRVASRRARSALRLLLPLFGERECESLREELAWVAGLLGEVRDLDVFLARIDRQLTRIGGRDDALLESLRSRRSTAQERVREELRTVRYERLVETLRSMELPPDASEEQRDWGELPVTEVAPELVERAIFRVRRWQQEVGENPDDEQLHRLRILLKRLRYACEFFADVLGEPVAAAIPPLVELQDCLGDHQDAVVAREALLEVVDGVAEDEPGSRRRLLNLGALIQVQREIQAGERGRFTALWGKLPKRIRRLRTALRLLQPPTPEQRVEWAPDP